MTIRKTDNLHSYRCSCGKLLFKGLLLDSTIQIKCRKCGTLMSFQGAADNVVTDSVYALMLNRQGDIISASSNIQKLFGYSLSELLLKNYGELLTPPVDEVQHANFDMLWSLKNKERYSFKSKITYWHKDKHAIPGVAQSKFVITPNGEVLFSVFSLGHDIPESTQEFLSLREYPFFLLVSREGICLDASIVRRRPYSRPRDEIVGKPFVTFMQEDVQEREALAAMLRTGKPFDLIGKRFERVDGTIYRMDVFFAPNFDRTGVFTDYSAYVFDHDLLRSHEQQFALNSTL